MSTDTPLKINKGDRARPPSKKERNGPKTTLLDRLAMQDLRRKGWRIAHIAARLGHTEATVQHYCRFIRNVVEYKYMKIMRLKAQGLSHSEIGERLGITAQTVSIHVAKARRRQAGGGAA